MSEATANAPYFDEIRYESNHPQKCKKDPSCLQNYFFKPKAQKVKPWEIIWNFLNNHKETINSVWFSDSVPI